MNQQSDKHHLTALRTGPAETPDAAYAGQRTNHRAAWMEAGWGIMHHYRNDGTGSLQSFNEQTDRFDVDALAGQIKELGARWLLMCVCHNATSQYWCAPNDALQRHVGEPVCTHRDLIADLAAALERVGVRMMVYVWPWIEAQKNVQVQDALAVDYPARWCDVIEEYSRRWGKRISGWWFDGAEHDSKPNLAKLAAAARAGNPQSAVAFNGGWGRLDKFVPDDDYCAGEHLQLKACPGQYDNGALRHILLPVGDYWGGSRNATGGVCPAPVTRFTDDELMAFMVDWVVTHRAAVTLDVPLQSYQGTIGGLGGVLPELYFRQLAAVAAALRT